MVSLLWGSGGGGLGVSLGGPLLPWEVWVFREHGGGVWLLFVGEVRVGGGAGVGCGWGWGCGVVVARKLLWVVLGWFEIEGCVLVKGGIFGCCHRG